MNGFQTDIESVAVPPTTRGGSLILAQEQDEVNAGGLDANQAFRLV